MVLDKLEGAIFSASRGSYLSDVLVELILDAEIPAEAERGRISAVAWALRELVETLHRQLGEEVLPACRKAAAQPKGDS